MRGLSLIILIIFLYFDSPQEKKSDSPHGDDLKISCEECHTSDGWEVDVKTISFRHSVTNFQLEGTHVDVSCASCHTSLVFNDASPDCMSCHTDMHEQTVGSDCARCHNSNSWIVNNTTEMHQLSRFPLLGAHATADCFQCHESGSLLRFDPLSTECVDCHKNDYIETTDPNHSESGYSTDCIECHQMNAFSWTGPNFTHTFFPLTLGHDIRDCSRCHTSGTDYSNISSDCFSCHESDYLTSSNPNHQQANLSTNCLECHTTNPDWRPADFRIHDNLYFPIYSGEHNGEWESCTDCHTTPSNYSIFTCTDCHEHNSSDMNEEHSGISGYVYSSNACFECHPTGSEDFIFNHNTSNFPLTGAHTTTDCASCHTDGYSGTSSNCADCHTPDYNQTTSPNHQLAEFSNECMECHTTNPGWSPADFILHDNMYFPIYSGEHNGEWTSCIDCHNTPDNYAIFTCIDCHEHSSSEMNDEHNGISGYTYNSNACFECHPTGSGEGAFDHSSSNFPLTGEHVNVDCASCHINGYAGTTSDCFECHTADFNQTVNPNHTNIGLSNDCASCHTTNADWQPATFNNHNEFYVLAGAHNNIASECNTCHNGDYNNTANTCIGCHQNEYNQTTDPPHASAQFSTDCLICHTESAWEPSTFEHDGQYFPIYSGKHNGEWNTCADCHTNSGDYSLFSCIDCHEHNQTDMNDEHNDVDGYVYSSPACLNCHPNGDEDFKINHIQNSRR